MDDLTKKKGVPITRYANVGGYEFRMGNKKLPLTTIIFNMGAGSDCPSHALNQCLLPHNKCYAVQAERRFKHSLGFRKKQEEQWKNCVDPWQFGRNIELLHNRFGLRLFRFNESGDFWSQDCVDKLSEIAKYIKIKCGIITYGYTARYDLDFSKASFNVRISHPTIQKEGTLGNTTVILRPEDAPKGYYLCLGDCRICSKCASGIFGNIAFKYHGAGKLVPRTVTDDWGWYLWKRERR